MRTRYSLAVMLLVLVEATGFAQSGPAKGGAVPTGDAAVVGVWRAQSDGLPWVTLTLTDEGGTLAGAVLFYLHRREPGGQVTATAGVPEPLLNIHLDGKSLTFKVSHRRAHPPESLSSPPVEFRLELPSDDHASLVSESEAGPSAALVRSDY
jgi:hypothetical protein